MDPTNWALPKARRGHKKGLTIPRIEGPSSNYHCRAAPTGKAQMQPTQSMGRQRCNRMPGTHSAALVPCRGKGSSKEMYKSLRSESIVRRNRKTLHIPLHIRKGVNVSLWNDVVLVGFFPRFPTILVAQSDLIKKLAWKRANPYPFHFDLPNSCRQAASRDIRIIVRSPPTP